MKAFSSLHKKGNIVRKKKACYLPKADMNFDRADYITKKTNRALMSPIAHVLLTIILSLWTVVYD